MDTISEPEHTEGFLDKPNNIVTIWKRLWPLIISAGLFVLVGIAWNYTVEFYEGSFPGITGNPDNWDISFVQRANAKTTPDPLDIAFWILLATYVASVGFVTSRLLPGPEPQLNRGMVTRYSAYLTLIVGVGIAIFVSSTLFLDLNLRTIGIIAWVGIAIVILTGRNHSRPKYCQAFVWLFSLILLITTQYLAWFIISWSIDLIFATVIIENFGS